MSELGGWLEEQMKARDYTQIQTAVHAGVSQGTISSILQKGHVPRVEALLRLADHFETDRIDVPIMANYLQRGHDLPRRPDRDARLVDKLLAAFAQVPDEFKQNAIDQVALVAQLTTLRDDSRGKG